MIHYWYARVVGKAFSNAWEVLYDVNSERLKFTQRTNPGMK